MSRYTRQRFLGWASISPELVKVIPNTVSERYVPVARNTARIQFGIDKHKVILTVGRLSAAEAYKGHDRILRCLKILRDRHPNLLYIIAGDGDDRARLESLAGILGVSEMVRFLGKVDDNQLAQLYSAADLFAMPSTGEGFGIVFLESMACGTPALGLDQDGSRDPLRDGLLGYISPPDGLCSTLDIALGSERPSKLADDTIHYFGVGTFRSSVARYLRAWPSWRNSGVN